MIGNVAILTCNDLAIAFKNKTIYLIIFMPLFVFMSMELVDENGRTGEPTSIGLIQNANYPPGMVESLKAAEQRFTVSWLSDEEDAIRWLRSRTGDGALVPPVNPTTGSSLVVLDQASYQTLVIIETVAALQRAHRKTDDSWISETRFLQHTAIQKQMLPTWILMLVLLVGFIVLPTQVAEEKEKKLLLGLLQTPIREAEWLLAKVLVGMILMAFAALLLQLLIPIEADAAGQIGYVVFLFAGGFCFSAFGVLIGFLCRTQASARTLGLVFYLPHLLPSALADFSQQLNRVAPLLPSYSFYQPIKSILLQGGALSDFMPHLLALFGVGLFAFFLSHQLMRHRWLM